MVIIKELTNSLTEEETKLLELFRKAQTMTFAALTVKIQNGKIMFADLTENIKF